MPPRKPRLAHDGKPPKAGAVTVTRTSARPVASRAAALDLLGDGADPRRLITQADGSVLIANHPPGIRRADG